MPATQSQQKTKTEPVTDPIVDGQPPPTPDEDGPHDVPDDKVIEATLPTAAGDGGKAK
jgi:hypothetical protein